MKKGLKKQIERELMEAIENTLSGHSSHAVSKTKKAIKEASKSVGKKFVKSLKALAAKKKTTDAKGKKKDAKKAKSAKPMTHTKVKARKRIRVRAAKKKVVMPPAIERSTETAENFLAQH